MIRFFSNLRKTQIQRENISKYLLYAIGEVSLIVIGIMIAFSIDNWKEDRERKEQEIKILKDMKNALILDSTDISGNVKTQMAARNACYFLAEQLENNAPWNDSLKQKFMLSCFNTIFDHTNGAYVTLKSKGLDLISNEALRLEINKYYDQRIGFNLEVQRFSLDQYIGYFEMQRDKLKNFKLYEPVEPWDFEALKKDRQYRSELTMIGSVRDFQANSFRILLKANKDLITQISNELRASKK